MERLFGRKTMEVEILKDSVRIAREKTDLARAVVGEGRHPVKAVAETMGVSRTHQYETLKTGRGGGRHFYRRAGDDIYLFLIRKIMGARPTYGYRRVTALMNRELTPDDRGKVKYKRVYRIMKKNNLLLQPYTGRPVRTHDGSIRTIRINHRWCSDAFKIPYWNGERVRVAFRLDCCDREVMSYVGTTGGDIRCRRSGFYSRIDRCAVRFCGSGPGDNPVA